MLTPVSMNEKPSAYMKNDTHILCIPTHASSTHSHIIITTQPNITHSHPTHILTSSTTYLTTASPHTCIATHDLTHSHPITHSHHPTPNPHPIIHTSYHHPTHTSSSSHMSIILIILIIISLKEVSSLTSPIVTH